MPSIDIKRIIESNPCFDYIESVSDGFRKPVIIKDVSPKSVCYKEWTNDYFKDKFKKDEVIKGKLHSASYWSDNPLMREYSSMTAELNPHYFFDENNASSSQKTSKYYIARFKRQSNEYLPMRRIPLNKLDNILLKELPSPNYTDKSDMTLVWLSKGNTESLLHSDPMHNAFLQVVGKKRFFLVSDRQRLSKTRSFLNPHLLAVKKPYIENSRIDPKIANLEHYDFYLEPGELLIIPAWCYHHVLSEESGLNISITNHFIPSSTYKLNSKTSMLAWFSRKAFPRLVKRRRINHIANSITADDVPFFPREIQYLKQAAKIPSWDFDAEYYLINESTREQQFIIDPYVVEILRSIDGKARISDIADFTNNCLNFTISCIKNYVRMGYLGLYRVDGRSFLNYYNHLAETY